MTELAVFVMLQIPHAFDQILGPGPLLKTFVRSLSPEYGGMTWNICAHGGAGADTFIVCLRIPAVDVIVALVDLRVPVMFFAVSLEVKQSIFPFFCRSCGTLSHRRWFAQGSVWWWVPSDAEASMQANGGIPVR